MQIVIDTKHDDPATLRLAASLLLTLSGDITPENSDVHTATGEQLDKILSTATPPPPPPPAETTTSTASSAGSVPPPPPLALTPPPPPPANTAGETPPSPSASSAAAASAAASAGAAEFDSAGMPWDARIHQKAKGKKKDGTWKLIKGIDTNVVQAVVRELQAAKLPASVTGAAPPVPAGTATVAPPVPLPPGDAGHGPVSVPPPPLNTTGVAELPASGTPAPVPVPPVAAVGGVPAPAPTATGTTYKQIIDKTITATKEGKLHAVKVNEVVQSCGAPSLMALAGMPHLFDEVNTKLDLAIAGLA